MMQILSVLLLTACSAVGNLAIQDKSNREKLVEGWSTKQQAERVIGEPTFIYDGQNGTETWSYLVTETHINPAELIPLLGLLDYRHEAKTTSLVLLFDNAGVLRKATYREASRYDSRRTN